ncbi:FAD-dependent monooxygenase [Agromyces bauzanensis]
MTEDVEVLVVGAGPTGLAAAHLFDRFGVHALVVDRAPAPSDHPRARGIRVRASELVRVWGFDNALRPLAMPGRAHQFIYCDTIAGTELARTAPAASTSRRLSSSPPYRVTQDVLEQVLEQAVSRSPGPAELRRGVECLAIEQSAGSVVAHLRSVATGREYDVRATYLVAADGSSSGIREQLGIPLGSAGPRVYWHSAFWRGDLSAVVGDRPAIVFYTRAGGDDALVGVGAAGPGRWVTFVQYPPSEIRPAEQTDAEAIAVTRAAVGVDDLPVELISTKTFRIGSDVAERYREGRVFLAGDAAHVLPPTGGMGINTGFADIHNLAWKLAFALRGAAGDELLDSYDRERRPIAEANVAWSNANRERLVRTRRALTAGDAAELQRLVLEQSDHVDPLMLDVGYTYGGPSDERVLETPTVGARAPHATTVVNGRPASVHDLVEGAVTVLLGGAALADRTGWTDAARGRGVEVGFVAIADLPDPDGQVAERYAPVFDGAVLVRPDGHVAWVASGAAATADAFASALDALLGGRLAN